MRLRLLALCFLLPVSSPLSAGVVFEIETQDHDFTPPQLERTTVYAEGLALKIDSSDRHRGNSDTMIFRGDRREMVVVDHERKSYMVIDRRFAANVAGQLNQMAGQVKGLLENVPAAQRAMLDQLMKNGGPPMQQRGQQPARPTLEVRTTRQQAKVYGYPCVHFTVTRGGRKVRDVWVTNWNNIYGGRELAATFDSMSEFVQELTSAFPVAADAPMDDNAFATMKQMGGFPVATREYRNDGTLESETALRSAEPRHINPADLQQPNGYQPETMFGADSSLSQSRQPAGRNQQGRR